MVSFICKGLKSCEERESSENNKMKKCLPTVGFEPGTFRLRCESAYHYATNFIKDIYQTVKSWPPFTFVIKKLPEARGRCSKMFCRVFLLYNICIVLLFDQCWL